MSRGRDAAAADQAHVFKLAVAQVAVKILALRIGGIHLCSVHLGIDVAVGDQDVEPAIVVDIDEAHTPAQQPGIHAQSRLVGAVVEGAVAEIHEEGVGIAGEIGLHNVEHAVAVVVADGNAHAGLRLAVGRVGHARLDGLILEGAVFLVHVVGGGGRVVGHVDIGPAVVVQVGHAALNA